MVSKTIILDLVSVERGGLGSTVRTQVRQHQMITFVVLAYTISWVVWTPLFVGVEGAEPVFLIVGAFGPPVAAAMVFAASGGDLKAWVSQLFRWRVSPKWYLVAIGLPISLVAVTTGIYVGIGGDLDPTVDATIPLVFIVTLLIMIVLGGGQEELGWRGFALPRLQTRYSALYSSVLVGVIWALWHLPLFFVPGASQANWVFYLYLTWVVAVSVMLTWVYNSTGGSVLLAMVLHGALNASLNLYQYPLPIDEEFIRPTSLEAIEAVVFLCIAAILVLWFGKRHLARRESVPTIDEVGGVR